jgi:hypothetical protein
MIKKNMSKRQTGTNPGYTYVYIYTKQTTYLVIKLVMLYFNILQFHGHC